jgi:hypothetical protein
LQPLLQSHLLQIITLSSLQSAQRYIYNIIVDHYRQIQMGLSPPPLRININREAGTSKLYLITVLSTILYNIVISNGKLLLLVQATPTRVTAFNINGRTIYNLLKLLVNCPFKELPITSLTPLQ